MTSEIKDSKGPTSNIDATKKTSLQDKTNESIKKQKEIEKQKQKEQQQEFRKKFTESQKKIEEKIKSNVADFNGRNVNPWGLGDIGNQGPPMLVNSNPKDLNPMSESNQQIARFNLNHRGDPRINEQNPIYTKEDLKLDQAWAKGDALSPIDGRTPLKGWLFRKIYPQVDPTSPFREPTGPGLPTPVTAGAVEDLKATSDKENTGMEALINLTESLNLNQVSPARAAEQAIALLVGPIQRAASDGSAQFQLWQDDLYNAINVPQRGDGLFRDFLASHMYSVAASAIYFLTRDSCGEGVDDPARAAAKAEAIKLSLLRDKNFSKSVSDYTLNIQNGILRFGNWVWSLGMSVLGIMPFYGDAAQTIVNTIKVQIESLLGTIDGFGRLGEMTGSVAALSTATQEAACAEEEKKEEEKKEAKMRGGGKNLKLSDNDLSILTNVYLQGGGGEKDNLNLELESSRLKELSDNMISMLNSWKETPEFKNAISEAAIKIAESTQNLKIDPNNLENYKKAMLEQDSPTVESINKIIDNQELDTENLTGGSKRKYNKFTKKYIKNKNKKKTKKRILVKYKKHRNGDFYKVIKKKSIN